MYAYIYCFVFYDKTWKEFARVFTDEYKIKAQGVV
jgi:hypothetical protein